MINSIEQIRSPGVMARSRDITLCTDQTIHYLMCENRERDSYTEP